MNFVEVLKECEGANGAGSKKVIQVALAKLDADGRKLMRYAMDPYTTFGVKKFDRPLVYATQDTTDLHFFFQALDNLAARQTTGNAARDVVTMLMGSFTKETAEYLERVIDKDLKAGFSAETFNKVWPSDPVPVFSVMLADKCEETEDFEKHVTFPCLAEFKLDGERTIAVVTSDTITYYSRSGKEAKHVDGLFDDELRLMHQVYGRDFVIDGERYARDFTETVNAKKEGNDEAKANLRFYAFFLMPLNDWKAQRTTVTMADARTLLRELILTIKDDLPTMKILLTVGREVQNYQDMMEFCNDAIDKLKVEGLILKDLKATYQWDRTFAWTKIKRFYDVDARIVGFYPGRPKTRFDKLGVPGGVNCVAYLEDGTPVEFNVGSGFSDDQRADMKANPEKWLKATHVIKFQEVSRAKNKAVASLRFCTYERTRDDKLVEI